tara:strand:- start:1415 stop:2131 length:717 start_codon:yes stop_codon:yes gene_type:complete
MNYKTFLMYYDRYENNTTSRMLDFEHTILCHENADKFKNISKKATIIETNLPTGIQNNFNYALRTLDYGEWAIFLSDDLIGGRKFNEEKYDFVECSVDVVLKNLTDTIEKADKMGVEFVGMSSTGNAFYVKSSYSYYGLVDTRCCAIKKSEFLFHPNIGCIPDYYCTAYHMKKNGKNLILNTFYLDFERYTDGGLGSIDNRLEQKMQEIKIMQKLFPDNVTIVDKPNHPRGSHIRLTR